MDLTLSPAQLELQARARAFVRDVLQPREVEFERAGGRVAARLGRPDPARPRSRRGSTAGRSPSRSAARAGRPLEQVLVHEQLGQATGGLWSYIPGAYNVLLHADADQRRRYLEPSLRGERSGSYAITEDGAGSDARALRGDRRPRPVDRRLRPQRREVVRDRARTTPTS